MGKLSHATIGIPVVNRPFTPVNKVLGRELAWENIEKSTAEIQFVGGMRQLLQESAIELTNCTELMTGYLE